MSKFLPQAKECHSDVKISQTLYMFRFVGLQLLKTNSVINIELLSYKSWIHSHIRFLCDSYKIDQEHANPNNWNENICEYSSKALG